MPEPTASTDSSNNGVLVMAQVRRYIAVHIGAMLLGLALVVVALVKTQPTAAAAQSSTDFSIAFWAAVLVCAHAAMSLSQWGRIRDAEIMRRTGA